MRITKRQLRRIIKEGFLREQTMMSPFDLQQEIEWGEWSGRPPNFEWNYVESEGPKDVRFDWGGGSMWYRAYSPPGTIEGSIPKHLVPHLKGMGFEVYAE